MKCQPRKPVLRYSCCSLVFKPVRMNSSNLADSLLLNISVMRPSQLEHVPRPMSHCNRLFINLDSAGNERTVREKACLMQNRDETWSWGWRTGRVFKLETCRVLIWYLLFENSEREEIGPNKTRRCLWLLDTLLLTWMDVWRQKFHLHTRQRSPSPFSLVCYEMLNAKTIFAIFHFVKNAQSVV